MEVVGRGRGRNVVDAELIYEILKKIKLKFFKMTNLLYVCVCVYVCVYVCCELSEIWSVKKTEMFFGTFRTKCAIV